MLFEKEEDNHSMVHEESFPPVRVCKHPQCVSGGVPQPLDRDHFVPNERYAGGFKTYCRACERQVRRDHYQAKREQELAKNRVWVEMHREERNAYQRHRLHRIVKAYHESMQPQLQSITLPLNPPQAEQT